MVKVELVGDRFLEQVAGARDLTNRPTVLVIPLEDVSERLSQLRRQLLPLLVKDQLAKLVEALASFEVDSPGCANTTEADKAVRDLFRDEMRRARLRLVSALEALLEIEKIEL